MNSENLVAKHPCRDRIERLFSGDFNPKGSNCFGTALYLIGVNSEPVFVDRKEMEGFLKGCKRPILPTSSPATIMCSQMFSNSYPTHAAIYLGSKDGKYVVVEQPGTTIPYTIREFEHDDWLLGPHFYQPNP